MNTETVRNDAQAPAAAGRRVVPEPSGTARSAVPCAAGRTAPAWAAVPVAGLQSNAIDDIEAILLVGGRNLETLSAISQLAVDCIYRCADGQAQAWNALCRSTFELMARPIGCTATPADAVRSPELSATVEQALGQLRHLSEIIARTNQNALELIANRAGACLGEVHDATGRAVGAAVRARVPG